MASCRRDALRGCRGGRCQGVRATAQRILEQDDTDLLERKRDGCDDLAQRGAGDRWRGSDRSRRWRGPRLPIQIVHVATAASASIVTRSRLKLGKGARATLVESFVAAEGAKGYQSNDAVMIAVGDGAELSHVRLMADAADAANISSAIVTAGAKTKLNLFNMTRGGAVSRYQGFFTLAGEGTDLSVNGINLLKDKQHGDTTLVVDHAVPHCTSRENFRAVVDDRGHSVFQGRIIVRPDARKTDGKMMTRALLLSDEAEADNKPELEIFADDVTCGHGATVRRARRQPAVLPAGARPAGEGSAGAPDPGLRRRGHRADQ